MTRINSSEIILEMWLKYYSRYFDDLWVFAGPVNGNPAGTFDKLKAKYLFNLVALEDDMYSMNAHHKVFEKQRFLLEDGKHDWTFYSDADEIVVADPEKYDGLRHFMDVCKEDQTFCVGYEVIQVEGESSLDYSKPLLLQRSTWCKDKTRSYSKPALSRVPTDWAEGFHYIRGKESEISSINNTGLFMLHMKHADPDRNFDYPRNMTGNHDIDKGNAEPIPEKVRLIF